MSLGSASAEATKVGQQDAKVRGVHNAIVVEIAFGGACAELPEEDAKVGGVGCSITVDITGAGDDVLSLKDVGDSIDGTNYYVNVQADGVPGGDTSSILVKVTVETTATPTTGTLFLFR